MTGTAPSARTTRRRESRGLRTRRSLVVGLLSVATATAGLAVVELPAQAVGAPGTIAGVASGRCLTVGGTANQSPVVIADCTTAATQQWAVANGVLTNGASKRCLSVANSGTANGSVVRIFDCNGSAPQKWTVRPNGSILNTNSGRCLDVAKQATANNSPLQLWDCGSGTTKPNQLWTVNGGDPDPDPTGPTSQPTGESAAAPTAFRLKTKYADQVDLTNALPEYPRPQMVRTRWQSLNGTWQFQGGTAGQAAPLGQPLPQKVNVPFGIEQPLSGVGRHYDRFFYRRTFTVPANWAGQHVKLNFGAVAQQSQVFVNGQSFGNHTGGYDAFSYDVTGALKPGANELVVAVDALVDKGTQPVGKQQIAPSGIQYLPSSGIWQTVWIEPTAAASISRLDLVPDVPGQALNATVQGTAGQTATVTAYPRGGTTAVGSATGPVGTKLRVPVRSPHLWQPVDPYLYDLKVTLSGGDSVTSYFGMRSVTLGTVGGAVRPLINGKFIFQFGPLDQGFWPDGGYTAPTDAALKSDIDVTLAMGYNMIRKHIKVEPQRFYYWADRLGVLVWQDMPSTWPQRGPVPAAARPQFESELHTMVDQHISSPSIVQWQPFNEGWGEYDPARLADEVKAQDPSRLVDNNSGFSCCGFDGGNGDVADYHSYPSPTSPGAGPRYAAIGEYGGINERVTGHRWDPSNTQPGYGGVPDDDGAAMTTRYVSLNEEVKALVRDKALSAAVYTQTTDVENEVNGLLTYDRAVTKPDVATIRASNQSVIALANSQTGTLRTGQQISLQVTTPGYTDRYVGVSAGAGVTTQVTGTSSAAVRKDTTFTVRAGLADSTCYSLESRSNPGQFLRQSASRVRLGSDDGSTGFAGDATFCGVKANDGKQGFSLRSFSQPTRYLRHYAAQLSVASNGGPNDFDSPTNWAVDTSFTTAYAWYRSEVDLPIGQFRSIQVTTSGLTDRYLRHSADLANTSVVNAGSDAVTKADATWRIVAGLADPSCYSFESKNFPGQYLRHSDFRIRRDASADTNLYRADATWCTKPGLSGTGVSFGSYNLFGRYMRHYESQVWNANAGGEHAYDTPTSFTADATWNVVAPWAP